ncbi:GNAT family N-acetyltransferase [Aquimarina aquimarini]|uniref:GNAT family N-acetyltransferase n=1 Tax=Aquimarina aquimarini TaxID=1191734 RepID=UPI00131F30A2|nr:GNAT family N-acetyltransferase [Aquimarina aquimarini]
MDFLSKRYKTKLNYSILIREAVAQDAEQLLALKLEYISLSNTIPLFDYEYANTTEEETEHIQNFHKHPNSLLLVAEYNGELIGNIDLTASWRKKMQHTAMIGMGIHTKWHNQGIGTLLIQNVLEWSKEKSSLSVIWLEVYASNLTGIALYKKMGFKINGSIPKFFLEAGKYIDKTCMHIQIK